jgi:uncharacterized protein
MADTTLDALGAGKYLLITTYRKNGTAVPTPVWVVRDGDALGVWTVADSWKVKRIRNRADVVVGPCDVRGNPTGESVPARAEILDAAGSAAYRPAHRPQVRHPRPPHPPGQPAPPGHGRHPRHPRHPDA